MNSTIIVETDVMNWVVTSQMVSPDDVHRFVMRAAFASKARLETMKGIVFRMKNVQRNHVLITNITKLVDKGNDAKNRANQ